MKQMITETHKKESSGATKWQQKSQVVFPLEFVSSH
jgi:hypothetical protein